ncbi:GDP-6-deoxy-D-mannose reductase [Paenibacillus sp. GM1FR]|uniref:GDP-mannose 4,6-dehydratase n=1 Tax=Paenibacillus sp. GM1FR TaxID=2059267 RepID=UPI000C278EEA|nr:GDP-mannose 4,6-dehydratase [Paenibacillus sp. GM1FR]PJN58960.1 GDP-6-deoxy-D-mannose reductase [Paenibacillus sp. GM1FR]
MKRVLITGINGFVGRYLGLALKKRGIKVFGTSRFKQVNTTEQLSYVDEVLISNISDKEEIKGIIKQVKPDVIFHLAAQSNVRQSWNSPYETILANTAKTLLLFESVKEISKSIRIVTIGSSEEYGYWDGIKFPIVEDEFLNPKNPYAVSKMNISLFVKEFSKIFDLDLVHLRPFNHIGPGQGAGFVVPDFAQQIVEIERKSRRPEIIVGNLNAKRDFTDVRDIVEAYVLAAEKGITGGIYNICSGESVEISYVLKSLISMSSENIEIKIDESKFRPNDIPDYYGSNAKFRALTSWRPEFTLHQTLNDVLNDIRSKRTDGK